MCLLIKCENSPGMLFFLILTQLGFFTQRLEEELRILRKRIAVELSENIDVFCGIIKSCLSLTLTQFLLVLSPQVSRGAGISEAVVRATAG